MIIDGYKKAEKVIKEYISDKSLHKGDNIENTISNLPRTFTKDDIRAYHPYVSESTINRALAKLKDKNNIKPLGKGRSAKWIRLVPEEMFTGNIQQYNIFDFMKNDED